MDIRPNMNTFFCPLPWNHLSVEPSGQVYSCCNSLGFPPLGDLKTQTLSQIWEGQEIKKLRDDFISGIKPQQCLTCINDEKNKNLSTRQISLGKFGNFVGNLKSPSFIGLRLDNLCNLSCRICSSDFSTSWLKDEKKLNQLPQQNFIEAFSQIAWEEFLNKSLNSANILYFAGGEPLLSKKLLVILKQLEFMGLTDVQIIINTNFSVKRSQLEMVLEHLKSFSNVYLDLSLDATHARAEFMRKGQIWNEVEENLLMIRQRYKTIKIKLTPTVYIFNLLHLTDFIDHMLNIHFFHPIDFRFSILSNPSYYSFCILPEELKTQAIKKIKLFIKNLLVNYELVELHPLIVQLNGIIFTLKQASLQENALNGFFEKTNALDNIRRENFWKTFPELSSLKNIEK